MAGLLVQNTKGIYLQTIIKRLARYKIYIDRSRWYYVLIQFFVIILIYFNTLDLQLDWWHYPIIFLVTISSMIVAGFIDRRIGMIREEQRFYSTENPVIQDILNRLKEFEKWKE